MDDLQKILEIRAHNALLRKQWERNQEAFRAKAQAIVVGKMIFLIASALLLISAAEFCGPSSAFADSRTRTRKDSGGATHKISSDGCREVCRKDSGGTVRCTTTCPRSKGGCS
jgi:hypothetical protein